uniref:RRM domain-containing protein n=1 Tax=Pelusios castaneus TaxID=367368 RepID=A0A8C8VI87_9SAUR
MVIICTLLNLQSAANPESQCASISREDNTQLPSTTSQGYVLPEGKIMPNTIFVGGIDLRMDETEIRSFFARYGTVKEVKIITDRTGSQINFHGKKLKLGPAIRKQQNVCAYHMQPRHLGFNPPVPQFHSVWSNQNAETYMPPPAMMSPVTQYVQANSYLLIFKVLPQWPPGEQRNYVIPPAYTSVNYHCSEVDPEVFQAECSVPEPTQSSGNSPQKKSVDRSIQTVVSCLFNPENRLRNTLVSQEDYFKV